MVGVAEQGELERVLGGERREPLHGVAGDPQNDRSGLLVLPRVVAHAACLHRAPRRARLRVEEEDDGSSAQVGERDRPAVLVWEGEGRGFGARLDHQNPPTAVS